MSAIAASTLVEFHIARRGKAPEPVIDRETAINRATGVWLDVPADASEADVITFVAQKVAHIKREVMNPELATSVKVAERLPSTPYSKPGFARWSVRLARPARFTL